MTYEQLADLARDAGFTNWAKLDVSTIDLKQEVRDMCAVNTCGMYNKRWSCPPGCGTLEECRERMRGYSRGILVQTVGTLEDEMDYESMQEIYEELGLRSLVRIDFIVRDDVPYFIEINTVPGSLASYFFIRGGMSVAEFYRRLLNAARLARKERERTIYRFAPPSGGVKR